MDSRRRRRLISAAGFGGAGLLLALALSSPLAFNSFHSFSPGPFTDSSFYYAGSQFKDACTGTGCYSGWTATYQYLQYMADLYTVAWCLLVAGILLSLLAFVFALIGAAGRPTALLTWILSITGAGIAILAPLTVLAFQPHAYSLDYNFSNPPIGYFPCGAPGGSVCTSFFGSTSTGAGNENWGAGLGWYVALSAGVLLLLGALVSRPPKNDPRIWPARFALLTVLGAAIIFAVVYSVIWRQFPQGLFSFYFTVDLFVIPLAICLVLGLWSGRIQRRARARGWTPS
ncbi:MAG: hypothetical protein ACLPZM_00900 [Thermoplasmata archaeon]